MKYIYTIILVMCCGIASAQQTETVTGRVELNDGKFVIESFTVKIIGDSIQVEMGDLKMMNAGSPTIQRFSVPAVFAVPVTKHQLRKKIDPNDFAGQIKATVLQLEELDGELIMDVEIKMNGDVMNRRLSWLFIPELTSVNEEDSFTGAGLLVNGIQRNRLYNRRLSFGNSTILENMPEMKIGVTTYTDTLIRYNLRVPYEIWMDDAVLAIHQVLGSPAGKEQLYTIGGAGRVKLQVVETYNILPKVKFVMPAPEQKSRNMQGQAFLDFASGRAVIVPTFRRNPEELAKIEAAIRTVQNDPDVNIVGLFVEGYASPEGSYTSNDRLARERAQALSNYITQNYGIPANIIRTSSVAEDWDGLRVLVEQSDLARKDEILAVIDSADEPDRKEQRLRAMGYPWTAMLNGMFPQLRRVEYQIDFTVKDYSLEESRNLLGRNPELLSQRELYLLADQYPEGSAERDNVFETIIRLYPDDPTAIINYSSILLSRGELAAAKRYLDRVADQPAAMNNLGVYFLLSGDLDTAKDYLVRAVASGIPEASHNLEELERKSENDALMERYNRK